jgi:recombination protein RecA
MSQALRKLTAILNKSKCTLIFINQIRMKIGVMFGNPETTTGGNALKFYSSVRLEIRRIESIDGKGSDDAVGNRVRVKIVKNKVAPPFKKVELDIMFGKGISYIASILDAAVKYGFIDKRGAWFTTETEKIGQGRENAIAFLETNTEYTKDLEKKLREKMFPGQKIEVKENAPKGKDAKKVAEKAAASANASASTSNGVTPPPEKPIPTELF